MKRALLPALVCIFILGTSSAYAHPPSDIKIEHNTQSRMLTVIVTHPVNNADSHFINKIKVFLNGEETLVHKISKQDNEKYQFAGYLIPGSIPGDTISVEAYCSVSGKLKKEIKVK